MRWTFSITTGQTALLRHPSPSNDPDFLQASRGSCLIHCRPVMSQDCYLPLSFLPLLPFCSFTKNSPCPAPSPSQTGSGRHSWLASSTFQVPPLKAIKRKRGRRSPQPPAYPNPLAAVQASRTDIIWHSTHQNSAVCTHACTIPHQGTLIPEGLTHHPLLCVPHPLQ